MARWRSEHFLCLCQPFSIKQKTLLFCLIAAFLFRHPTWIAYRLSSFTLEVWEETMETQPKIQLPPEYHGMILAPRKTPNLLSILAFGDMMNVYQEDPKIQDAGFVILDSKWFDIMGQHMCAQVLIDDFQMAHIPAMKEYTICDQMAGISELDIKDVDCKESSETFRVYWDRNGLNPYSEIRNPNDDALRSAYDFFKKKAEIGMVSRYASDPDIPKYDFTRGTLVDQHVIGNRMVSLLNTFRGGITRPHLYPGRSGTFEPWHDEDWLTLRYFSLIDGHENSSRVWFGLPDHQREAFDKHMYKYRKQEWCQYTRHKNLLIDPFWLRDKGLTVTVGVQRPNESVVTMSGCQHTVINHGWSLGVGCNFVTAKHLENIERGQKTNCLGFNECGGNYVPTPSLDVTKIEAKSNPDVSFISCNQFIYNDYREKYGHIADIPSIEELNNQANIINVSKKQQIRVEISPDEVSIAKLGAATV